MQTSKGYTVEQITDWLISGIPDSVPGQKQTPHLIGNYLVIGSKKKNEPDRIEDEIFERKLFMGGKEIIHVYLTDWPGGSNWSFLKGAMDLRLPKCRTPMEVSMIQYVNAIMQRARIPLEYHWNDNAGTVELQCHDTAISAYETLIEPWVFVSWSSNDGMTKISRSPVLYPAYYIDSTPRMPRPKGRQKGIDKETKKFLEETK